MLSIKAVEQRIKHDVEALAAVIEAKPIVTSRGRKVDIQLELSTEAESNVPLTSEEVFQVVRDGVEKEMGVSIGRLKTNIYHQPFAPPKPPETTPPPEPNDLH